MASDAFECLESNRIQRNMNTNEKGAGPEIENGSLKFASMMNQWQFNPEGELGKHTKSTQKGILLNFDYHLPSAGRRVLHPQLHIAKLFNLVKINHKLINLTSTVFQTRRMVSPSFLSKRTSLST